MKRLVLAFSAVALLSGCSATTRLPKEEKLPQVFRISTRRLPPQPTYNRLRWVNLESLPSRDLSASPAPLLTPVIKFETHNTKLDEAAKMLAATAQYSSYCASTIANQKITLNRLGTIDELGEAIGRQAGIRVVVDHEGRSVRFFPQQAETPKFYGSTTSAEDGR